MKVLKKLSYIFLLFFTQLLIAEDASEAAEMSATHSGPNFWDYLLQPKFIVMLAIGLLAFILLKTNTMKKGIKVPLLLLSTFLFGVAGNIPADFFGSFAMHPSPMCAATKSILYGFGMPFIVTLAVIFFLTLLGPKLFCSYVCPVGAIQELMAMLADKLGIKRGKTNFNLAQRIRLGIFLLFIFLSATAVLYITYEGQVYAKSLYDYINPFHGMELSWNNSFMDYMIHYLPFVLTLLLALKYYRPFCHFVCPIGLFNHFIEQISLFKISFKKDACTDCGNCLEESPCTAIPEILKDAAIRPDCYGCNVCVEACPESALKIGTKRTVVK